MELNEYECKKQEHVNCKIIGFCLNQDCKEARQLCGKCLIDSQIHNQCRPYCLNFQQIEDNIQGLLNYFQYLISYLNTKLKVMYVQWMKTIQIIKEQQQKLEQILNNLIQHKFQDFKTYLPLITKYSQHFTRDKKFMLFLNGLRLSNYGAIEDAIKSFDELITYDEKYGQPYYQKGLLLMKSSKTDQEKLEEKLKDAAYCFDKAIMIDRYNYDAFKQRGICLFQMKQYDKALDCFNTAIEQGPYNEDCFFYKGRALQENDENQKACDVFNKIINDNNYHCDSYYYKGLSLFNLKNYNDAVEQFDKVLKLDPTYINAYIYKGQALIHQNTKEEAMQCFTEAIKIDSLNLEAYLGKTQLYNAYEDKLRTLNEAKEAGIKSIRLIYEKGIVLQIEKKFDQAIEQYDQAIEQYDQAIEQYHKAIEQYDQASEQYHKAMEQYDQASEQYHQAIEQYHQDIKQYHQAIEQYKKILNDIEMEMLYFNKGIIQNLIQKKYLEAIDCFNKARDIQSKKIETLVYLGYSLQRQKQHQEAIQCFDEAISKGFQNENIYYKKGRSLYILKQYTQAIRCLDQAESKCQQYHKVHQLKNEINKSLTSLGKNTEASQSFEKAKQLQKDKKNVMITQSTDESYRGSIIHNSQ